MEMCFPAQRQICQVLKRNYTSEPAMGFISLKQTNRNKNPSSKHGLNPSSQKNRKTTWNGFWCGRLPAFFYFSIFSQHLFFFSPLSHGFLNGSCYFFVCGSPGTLSACNVPGVPSLKMCRDFDNHVKQTLSHSCVIRNSLLKTPWRC